MSVFWRARQLGKFLCIALAALVSSASSMAQIATGLGDVPAEQQVGRLPPAQEPASPVDRRVGTYGPVVSTPEPQEQQSEIPPFGAELFTGGFRGPRALGLNPSYRILPGDQITLRVWGAVEFERVLVVDAQGNVFVPYVGPVHVEGVSHGELDAKVKAAIKQVFPDNVSVYTNLQGVQPVAVFVTGYVKKPGRYAGNPSDSLLYFLDQASGIDQASGSYRRIRILRDGGTIAEVDLYDFLVSGKLPRPQFQDGDTIVVERRGPVVTVSGDVAQAYRFELDQDAKLGHELIEMVQLKPGVSHVLLRGVREDGPFSKYLSLHAFRDDMLKGGDEVLFSIDQRSDVIVVQIEGSYKGPSRFAVPKDATLQALLDSIEVDPALADVRSISIRRESVAQRQRQALEDALRRLETTYLSAPSRTDEEARIRVQEAQLIQDFVKRAREVKPNGRMVVAYDGRIADVRLQDGDVITIPERSDSLLISGEVQVPQAIVYVQGHTLEDYIRRAGGFTDRADQDNILIVRQNGEVVTSRDAELRPGDEVLVLPAVPTKNLQLASTIAEILFRIAVTTRTILNI
mgnify:FL=1